MGVSAGSIVMGTPLPGLRAWADQPAGAAFKLSAPEPHPKYGGTLRYGVLSAPAHFDVHHTKTYTFFLRQGVQFHDGAEFTAEDVKATYARIIWPPKGISIPRNI
jgi:peptide/nickel transport system substrate-binding protein